ncbi:hypothetical protein EUV02_09245 [Polymorphobacter arshaanensis]|uniref:Na+-dependent transporter n=1 Tax=Glacieibacterium arshaanense TaxID=2511025 RepID=A0A4Y9EMR8_9SPHN|nr:hypothetical protein [Polymorphobacter arshaanensis]TFU03355.1 hypothetical protein EUV02_09245 [Polymorphobacter arshaanensis]
MDPAMLVKLVLVAGIVLIVISIGVRSRPEDTLQLIRNPGLGVRAMTAMFVAVPAFVLFITWLIPFDVPVRAALLALAVSPMPPIIPRKEMNIGGDANYAIGLQVLGTVFSIVAVPFMLMAVALVFGVSGEFDPFTMSKLLVVTVGAPLVIGMAIGRLRPDWRDGVAVWAGKLGTWALLAGAVVVLFGTWQTMLALIGGGVLVTIVAIIGFALAVGHWLGGPDEGNRGALAVACAARHPGVAIALSTTVFPERQVEITGAVLLFLLVNLVVTVPYMKWRQKVVAHG